MNAPRTPTLALLAVRRALGIAVALDLFYVAAHYAWGLPFPTPLELAFVLLVVAAGVALGVAFSLAWPMPQETGRARVVRTVLLTIPALGIGIAVQVFLVGPSPGRAYYVMLALAAWLGSGFVRADEADEGDESPPRFPFGPRTSGDGERR